MSLITGKLLRRLVWFLTGLAVVAACALGLPALQASATTPGVTLTQPTATSAQVAEALDTMASHLAPNFYQ